MSDELKPCPNPKCDAVAPPSMEFNDWAYTAVVTCPACGTRGPVLHDEEVDVETSRAKARDAWNALPRALRWTSEPPSVPGVYFHKHPGAKPPHFGLYWTKPSIVRLRAAMEGPAWKGAMFAGPVPEPVDPPAEGGAA